MKKQEMLALAMIGITAGVFSACEHKDSQNPKHRPNHILEAAENMTPEMQQFYTTLNPETQKVFNGLDLQHKMIAMQMSSQSCQGLNACRGLGGCATNANDCAGQNACQGQGGNPLSDPNRAVALAAQKQREKREHMYNQMRQIPKSEPSPPSSG